MQFSSASQENHAPGPTLLQGLQDRAHASLQATAQVVKEQVSLAGQAASDRVKTAKAGKRLLDEGGESAAQMVAAKGASVAASDTDRSIARRVHVAIYKLDDSVAKLRAAQLLHCTDNAKDVRFLELADEHEGRAAACKSIAEMLEIPALAAEMSPEEFDALAIVNAKAGCSDMVSWTSHGLVSMRQQTLAGVVDRYTVYGVAAVDADESDEVVHAPRLSSRTAYAPTLLEGLQERAWAGVGKVKQTASDRIETAQAAKRLLDEGGERIAQVVVAKRACIDAAEIDRDVAERVQSAIGMFDNSAARLRALQSCHHQMIVGSPHDNIPWIDGISCDVDLAKLVKAHELRAITYRQIAGMLQEPISSVDMDLAEWDALSIVKVKDGCSALQCRTNEGFEAFKGLTYSGCTPERHNEGHRERSVCA